MTGLYIVALALALALGFGLYRKAVDGRVRPVRATAGTDILGLGTELGSTASFVQFSSAVCAPCRATSKVLDEVSSGAVGVAHIEIDAEHRLDLVEQLGITRTPTVLVLDRDGVVRGRMVGAPRRADVLQALAGLTDVAPGAVTSATA